MKELKFRRRLSRSTENRAATVTVPRAIAQAWEGHDIVELVFDGNSLLIKPVNETKTEIGDDGDDLE